MAGAFTHMGLVLEAIDGDYNEKLKQILNGANNFVIFGSVSPDIPYLSFLRLLSAKTPETNWADVMHYNNIDKFTHNALRSLLVLKNDKVRKSKIAWLCGYVSHLVADATVHPVIEAMVGPCVDASTKGRHMEVEMIQDAFVLDLLGHKVETSEFSVMLRSAMNDKSFNSVAGFWSELLKMNFPSDGAPNTISWVKSYVDMLDSAETTGVKASFLRHLPTMSNKVYRNIENISDDEAADAYRNVKLPIGKTGPFYDLVYLYAKENIINVWNRIGEFLFTSPEQMNSIIPNWNLDTGIDQSTLSDVTYWRKKNEN